jgi:subtilisin family serine protease
MERETSIGCGPTLLLALFLLWLVGLPAGLRAVGGELSSGLLLLVAGVGLVLVFGAIAWSTRRRSGWRTVAAFSTALLALSGFLTLDAVVRTFSPWSPLGTAALRLGLLLAYVAAAAWWAPRLAGLGALPLTTGLGLDRFRLAPLALGIALAAVLSLPWPLTGALGDRLTSLELLAQTLARVLPDIVMVWGIVFLLLNGALARSWTAGLLTMLAYWVAFAAGQFLAPSADTLLQEVVVLAALPLLLTELRARDAGVYPLLPVAWGAYAAPFLFTDPRDALTTGGIPELTHLYSYGIVCLLALLLGLALWAGRKVVQHAERQTAQPFLHPRTNSGIALALALAALIAWGGLFAVYGKPRFYDDGFLLILSEQADLDAAAAFPDRTERLAYVYRTLVDTADRTQGPLRAELDALGVPYRSYYLVNMIRVDGHRWLMGRFTGRPDVAQVLLNPNVRDYPFRRPLTELLLSQDSTPSPGVQENLQAINAPAAWDLGVTGEGIVVAGEDTGFSWTHPALQAHYRGWDGQTASHDYNWHDAWDDTAVPWDDDMHGTHTMGTVLGDDGAGNRTGVAPGARWIGCRNMRRGFGNPAAYIECMEFLLAPYPHGGDPFHDGDVTKSPHVINNSWGCPPWEGCAPDTLARAAEVLRTAGVMMVVSAGNEGPACATVQDPPASYDDVFSIGATDLAGQTIASFSSRGPAAGQLKPDISAPGQEIRSSVPGGGYTLADGTSMAGPHVVGVVALVWSADPALIGEIDATEVLLCQTARSISVDRVCTLADAVPDDPFASLYANPICACGDVAGVPNNVYGCGVIDAAAAVRAALAGQ